MEVILKEVRLEEDPKKETMEFEKFYDNSYKHAMKTSRRGAQSKLNWEATFYIEDEEEEIETEYRVDTRGNYITFLNLDGYLEGEVANLGEDVELHLAIEGNSILEALTFIEVKKLGVLPDEKLKALEYSLFPKFAKGYIATDLKQDANVSKFMEIFYPLLQKFEILKEIKLEKFRYRVSGGNEETQERFKTSMEKYLFEQVKFIYYDKGYGEFLAKRDYNELLMAGTKYEPDMTMKEMYE